MGSEVLFQLCLCGGGRIDGGKAQAVGGTVLVQCGSKRPGVVVRMGSTPMFATLMRQRSRLSRDIPDGLNLESIQARKDLEIRARTAPRQAWIDLAPVADRNVFDLIETKVDL